MTATVFRPVSDPPSKDWKRCLEALEMHAQALERLTLATGDRDAGSTGDDGFVEIGFGPLHREPKRTKWQKGSRQRQASWATDAAPETRELVPLPAYPGYANAAILLNARVTIGFFIAKGDEAKIESIVRSVFLAQRERKDFAPVFVTESLDFHPLLKRGYVFEYLPPVPNDIADPDQADSWRKERFELIQAKWGISYFVNDVSRIANGPGSDDARPRIIVFPDYGAGNPYLDMMYRGLRQTWNVGFDSVEAAALAARHGPIVFHLHWEDAVYRGERADVIPDRMASFIAAVDSIKSFGGRFVWTVHNLQPHDPIDGDLHREFVGQLLARADIVHVNNRWAADRLHQDYGMDLAIRVVDHPSYAACYPAVENRAEAAAALSVEQADDRPTFLFMGQIRRYKGLERLLNAAPRFVDSARFVIAGRSGRYDPCGSIPSNCIRVEGFADDETVSRLFAVADFVVLPFERLTTSGSLLLALSFGKPVIAPNFNAVVELVSDGREAFIYDPAKPNGLADAIERALDAPEWQLRAMGKAAEATAAFRAPEAFSAEICDMYARLLDQPSSFGAVDEPDTSNVTVMPLVTLAG